MTGRTKIMLGLAGIAVALPVLAIGVAALFLAMSPCEPTPGLRREVQLPNHGTLIIDGARTSRSEHGFSQRAGYRPPGSDRIEWFGDVSDGVEPQFYQAGPLVVVIDAPAAQLYIRTELVHVERGDDQNRRGASAPPQASWKSLALVFPNDLGPFPISFYADRTGLTMEEIGRINKLGGTRAQKWPTTYIQSFDPAKRDLDCSYHVDNKSSWPLHLRLSEDGTHLALIAIGAQSH